MMQYPLSFGVGQQGGFTGYQVPQMTSTSGVPTLGTFQGGNMGSLGGMMGQVGLANAIGGLFSKGSAPVSAPNFSLQSPQAFLAQGPTRPQMLGNALAQYRG